MVKVGDFSLQLVDATTKEPFKEHVAPSDGQSYAEVEPGLDYFISVGSDRAGGVMFYYKVDGVHLGYSSAHPKPTQCEYKGNWSRIGGVGQTTSFRFNIAQTRSDSGGYGDTSDASMMTGKVELIIYELGAVTYKVQNDFTATSQAKELDEKSKLGDAKMKGKKCLVSTAGSVPLNENKSKSETKPKIKSAPKQPVATYTKGKYITTLTLNYCSTVGLIINKILDPPPEESDEEEIKQKKKRAKTEKKKGELMI